MGLFDSLKPKKYTFYSIQYTLKKCEGVIAGKHEIFWGVKDMRIAGGNDAFGMKLIIPKEYNGLPVRVILPRGFVNIPLLINLEDSESVIAVSCNQGSERGAPNIYLGMRAMRWTGVFMTKDPSHMLLSVCSPSASDSAYVMTHRYWRSDLNTDPDGYGRWIREQLRGDGKELSRIGRDSVSLVSFEDKDNINWTETNRYIVRAAYDLKPFAYKIYDEECVVVKLLNGHTPTQGV